MALILRNFHQLQRVKQQQAHAGKDTTRTRTAAGVVNSPWVPYFLMAGSRSFKKQIKTTKHIP